jgi:predicted Zn finger-like uncharacterized protein
MIARCAHCNAQMKIDEVSLPDKPRIKVRCPHCRKTGYIERPPRDITPPESDPAVQAAAEAFDSTAEFRASELAAAKKSYRPSSGADAFKDFQFPAEMENDSEPRKSLGRGVKIVLWAIASLAVIAFFALIVNVILPGPGGGGGILRAVQPKQDTSTGDSGGRPTLPSPTDRGTAPLGK